MVYKYTITMPPYEVPRDVRRKTRDSGFIIEALADPISVGEQQMNVPACETLGLQ